MRSSMTLEAVATSDVVLEEPLSLPPGSLGSAVEDAATLDMVQEVQEGRCSSVGG